MATKKKSPLEALESIAIAERAFLNSHFLSPRCKGQGVTVRVAGIVCKFSVVPLSCEGWGVFRPLSWEQARWERAATLSERDEYLKLFPILRLIVSGRANEQWFGVIASDDGRFRVTGNVPIFLGNELQLFDIVRTRFDGAQCWYDRHEPRADLRQADEMRRALAADISELNMSGLSPVQRKLYGDIVVRRRQEIEEANRDKDEERLREALVHAGAVMRGYKDRGNSYTVEYMVDGQRHTSTVDKGSLAVQAAGICLSGGDRNFDLTSLVTVIREGQRTHRINRVGDNYGYDDDD